MRPDELLSKEWCDLVFSGRNKAYGAYRLRAEAGMRCRIALCAVLGVLALWLLGWGTVALYNHILIMRGMKEAEDIFDRLKPSELKEGYKVKFLATARLAPSKRMSPNAVSSHPEIVEGIPLPQIVGLKGPIDYDPEDEVITTPIVDTTGISDKTLPVAKEKIVPTEVVSQIPAFPGGPRAFMKWLDENIGYPQQCINRGSQGTATASFIVGTDGYATDFEVKNAPDQRLYGLIMGALKRMPRWKAGTDEHGMPTPVKVTVPIMFKI